MRDLKQRVWPGDSCDRVARTDQHVRCLARTIPGQRVFARRNLFRMGQLFETYSTADKRVTALLTQLPWTRDLIVLTKLGRPENKMADQCRLDCTHSAGINSGDCSVE